MVDTKQEEAPHHSNEPPPINEDWWNAILSDEHRNLPDSFPTDYVLELEKRASVDALTGVGSYRKLIEIMQELEHEHARDIGFLFFDGNNFGQINKTLTQEYGDAYVKQTAKLLQSNLDEEKSKVFRIGGDEFVTVLYGLQNQDDVDALGLRMASVFRGGNFPDGKPIPTVSIGGVFVDHSMNDSDLSNAIIGANVAMKDAKKQQTDLPKVTSIFQGPDENISLSFFSSGYQPFQEQMHGPLRSLPRPQTLAK